MSKKDYEVLNAEFARANDRAAAVVAAAFLDEAVRGVLEVIMLPLGKDDPDLFSPSQSLGSFMARANLAYRLGLIDRSEWSRLGKVAKIRNEFAHITEDVSFETPRIKDRCLALSVPLGLVPPRHVPPKVDLATLHTFRTPIADRSDPRAIFEEATLHLLFVLAGRRVGARERAPSSPKTFTSAGEPVGELLAQAMVARDAAIKAGESDERVQALKDQVETLVSVVVHATVGGSINGRTDEEQQ